jgi:hypothetical protein
MKTTIKTMAVIFAATSMVFFNSCKKEETPAKPVINILELGEGDGHGNDHTAVIGGDLHIEAEIVAEGTIHTVQMEIHPEGNATWEFEITYTEFSGLKNATLHKHIDIPLTAEPGDYHFHLIVTDMNGNQTRAESEIQLQAPADSTAPQITVTSAPANGQAFGNGDTISISGTATDNLALGEMYIGLVRNDQNLTDPEVNADNTITLLHTHDFSNPSAYNYSASIVVGTAFDNDITPDPVTWTTGNYYILVKCKDAFGANWTFSSHYPIVIN